MGCSPPWVVPAMGYGLETMARGRVTPETVFLLWHTPTYPDQKGEDSKLIGVYRTAPDAADAQSRVAEKPGFRDYPDGFEIVEYTLNRDGWVDGFVDLDGTE